MHSWWLFLAARCKALCPKWRIKRKFFLEKKVTHFKSLSNLCKEDNYEEINWSPTKTGLLLSRGRPQLLICKVQ